MLPKTQWIVIVCILIEFGLVVVFVAMVYVVKIRSYFRGKAIAQLQEKFTKMLQVYAADNNLEPFRKLRQFGLLLFTARQKPVLSKEQLTLLVKEIILPNQMNNINSNDWKRRYRLMACFEHYIDATYYTSLIRLIHDPISIIRINACILGSTLANDNIFRAILEQFMKEDRSSRTLFIDNFKENKAFSSFLFEQLKQTDSPMMKRIIYDILNVIGCDPDFFPLVREDCFEGELNKRAAAIRCLPKTHHPEVISTLKLLMKDDDWLVRNVAVRALGELNGREIIDLLGTMLSDPNWWVKTSAAKMLCLAGDEGTAMLKKIKGSVPGEVADFAEYYLGVGATGRGKRV